MVCTHCGELIYFGQGKEPLKKYKPYDDSWKTEVWRHTHSKNAACDTKWASPAES